MSFSLSFLTAVRRSARLPRCSNCRGVSTVSGPVKLDFTKTLPESGNETSKPLVILHGLFGSKRNWTSLSKAFARDLDRPVYTLDLRNHGESPHALPMTYEAMATDVLHFFDTHGLSDVSLLGHSMGGKVAMSVALDPALPASLLQHLVVVDIAPSRGRLSGEFLQYTAVMKQIEGMRLKTRKEAAQVLAEVEKDASVVTFLLTNLVVPPASSPDPVSFRIPVELLSDSVANLGDFPYEKGERTWGGKTLFVKGEKSAFINRHNIPVAEAMFPGMVLKTLPTNHWVHAEKPMEFKEMVTKFIT
ncbi:alpha/beta-hydrolase [Cylindrobasidium torrendii FP15055 ss-10]|uniref:Alpha/beta-hydrolase n=1 Tax=Cylindrobasidium torrendii FP15055 ss-10 TaxID=1314674 RepID=A0A0D7BBB5_9AGAR|nr:alpha/beta-hydrolase [Cylindrobasidium torrendii FP15055 ss-10]